MAVGAGIDAETAVRLVQIAIYQAMAGDIMVPGRQHLPTKIPQAMRVQWAIAVAQAKAGDVDGGKAIAATLIQDMAKSVAYSQIAAVQRKAGDTRGALKTLDLALAAANRVSDRNKTSAKAGGERTG